jgi:hypothetical protein
VERVLLRTLCEETPTMTYWGIALTALLVLHGVIHLLGFLKWSGLAAIPELSGRVRVRLSGTTRHVLAWFWFGAFATLLLAAALRIAAVDGWWVAGLAGIVVSQPLIVVAWRDAKFGTIANVLIFVPAIVAAADARFEHQVDDELTALWSTVPAERPTVVTPAELYGLPAPVRGWLETSGVVGRERAITVRLRQRGELRTSPGGRWIKAEADQYFTVVEPAFVWKVDTTMMGFLPIAGRDRYAAGEGHMQILAASIVPIVDAGDDKIASGAMLRFLGEIVWFPSAALAPYITWAPLDATSAIATMRHRGLEASATFTFDERGRVSRIRAERYLGGGDEAVLTPWGVTCSAWREIRGTRVPIQGVVSWKLEEGEFSYYRWEILDIEQNRSEAYDERPRDPPRVTVASAGSALPE